MKTVLVTGGTGVVGKTLVDHLLELGFKVRILSRGIKPTHSFYGRTEVVIGDITDPVVAEKAVKNILYVYHLASKTDDGTLQEREAYQHVNVLGTELLTRAAIKAGVKRIVYFSSISVYGPAGIDAVADESTVPLPASDYGRSKFEAEAVVLSAKSPDGKPAGVILRVASVYGPPGKRNYGRLIAMISKGLFVSVGTKSALRTLIHDQDLARAAILAADHPEAGGKIYNITDGRIYTVKEIADAISAALGRAFYHIRIPNQVAAAVKGHALKLSLFFPFISGIKNLVDKMSTDTAVSGGRIQTELGFQPGINLYSGWRDAVKRYKLNKLK